ncbi:GAF domain-containing protein [Tropicimonas sp. IMCC6043]|uniref:GAF domain-containing protein n=1 Tax=Tropicimonas sp. IMCC6043 TaxID=2510645 RepID=UPI00101C9E5B|nr:GAF domain-containing protein [Tropicimonas sp. IMCC6043]RYH08015.1 GAF domain-containing protein [Tropicimonas sp. IMCC6043]
MSDVMELAQQTFIQVSEIWVPEGDRLVLDKGNYGGLDAFAAASHRESFAKSEGLPGKAWAEGRPVVLKEFDGSYFKRTEAAKEAGLTSAVAVPVFAGAALKAVLVVLCGDDAERTGALEVWEEEDGLLMLDEGYYGAAKHFEWVSQHTHFPRGQGLPGGVWAASAPILMRDLGSGYHFIRADSAGKAGLTTGLGLPIPSPSGKTYVLTLLSARGTPIARRFEIWDARASRGAAAEAILTDGICERDGPLWSTENPPVSPPKVTAWQGALGQVLGSGLPVVKADGAGLPVGYRSMVALPIYREDQLAYVVAWYL